MRQVLDALAARIPVDAPVALVAAHPDDETIGAGAMLPLFRRLLLVHMTDGAPRGGDDARAHGFDSPAAYAAARAAELQAALRAGDAAPKRACLKATDQEAALDMPGLADRLHALLARHGAQCVITHPYEGGHPDHDAAALIVRLAASRMPKPPEIVEFMSYHAGPDGWVTGRFLPGPEETVVTLSPQEQARKRAMLACHATQAQVLRMFGVERERFRPAPNYDFSAPPHPGTLNYEGFGWGWTGARWRGLAAAALRETPCAA